MWQREDEIKLTAIFIISFIEMQTNTLKFFEQESSFLLDSIEAALIEAVPK